MRAHVIVFAFALIAKSALAQPNDPAVARELFEEARVLMTKGDFAEAEKRLTAALEHSSGRGIKYQLAVCHEKLGHVARAWLLYVEVAEGSRVAGETDRERVARARAAELTPRVPHVRLAVSDADAVVRRDDETLASWDAPLALDPGKHAFHVEAAGHKPWDGVVELHEGDNVEVRVPSLELDVVKPPLPPPPLPLIVVKRPFAEHVEPLRSTTRTFGLGVGVAGVLALGVGAGFVVASAVTYGSASSMCDALDHCSPQGAAIRGDALTYGDVATGLLIGGAVALAAGAVMWLVAPKRSVAQHGLHAHRQ